jgi:uncharacterized coiled-coil protein SlyX
MATIKELQTRIQLKYDSYENWKDSELVLLPGEIGLCEIPGTTKTVVENGKSVQVTTAPTVLFKVGNANKTPFKDLPWASAKAADVYNWAKAATVEVSKVDGKEYLIFKDAAGTEIVEGRVDLSRFALAADVKTTTDGLASRISALETNVGADGDLGKVVADHETRLGVIEGEGEGSIKKAFADAKTDASNKDAVVLAEAQKYADQAEADAVATANAYTDTEVAKVSKTADDAAAAIEAHEAKQDNPHKVTAEQVGLGKVENKTVAEIKTEFTGAVAADNEGFVTGDAAHTAIEAAKTAANTYADGLNTAMDERVGDLEAAKATQDTTNENLAKAITDEATARENADKAITDTLGTGFDTGDNTVAKKIAAAQTAAQTAAEATAKGYTDEKVKALADGQVEANRAAIAAMDEAYKEADEALDGRLDTVEAKLTNVTNVMDFIGVRVVSVSDEGVIAVTAIDDETFNKGDVVVDNSGKEYVYDGEAWHEFGNTDANAAAIGDLQGRMNTAEGEIDTLQKAVTETLPAADSALGQRIDGVITDYKAADTTTLNTAKSYAEEKASAAESAAKSHAETKASEAQAAAEATAKGYTDEKVETLEGADEAMAADIEVLKKVTAGYTDEGSIKSAVDAKLAEADFTSWKTTHEADHAKTATKITEEIAAAVKVETDDRVTAVNAVDAKVTALDTRVGTAEGEIDALQAIVSAEGGNSNAQLRADITALQELTSDATKGNAALQTELARVAGLVDNTTTGLAATKAIADKNKTDIEDLDSRVEAIEGDYLKQEDLFIINCGSATSVVHEPTVAAE